VVLLPLLLSHVAVRHGESWRGKEAIEHEK
jgi:hypothetical protein